MKISNQEYIDELLKKSGINNLLQVVLYFEFYKKDLEKPHYKKLYDIFRKAFAEMMSMLYDSEIDEESCNTLIKTYAKGSNKQEASEIRDKIKMLAESFKK